MIVNVRTDYSGPGQANNPADLSEFIEQIQKMLSGIADEINQQNATLVIKVYDGKRMNYSFENISPDTMKKVIQLSRPQS